MNPSHRIIDANTNRAREGLRCVEEAARFVLDDPDLTATAKALRHDVSRAVELAGLGRGVLLASRNSEHDVGIGKPTPTETARADQPQIVSSACGRTSEALRALEEQYKLIDASESAGLCARARYRVYELERAIVPRLGRLAPQWTLCVLVSEALCAHAGWLEVCASAIDGGADCIQLREKSLPDRELLARARALVELCKPAGASVIVNDRPDIARLAQADGVHLGRDDLSVADARQILGPGAWVGVSTANMDEARTAARAGASYCGLGPVFASSTKPKDALAGLGYVRAYVHDPETTGTPHLAISGIDTTNIAELASAGCRGAAVSSAVCAAADPAAVCRELVSALRPEGAAGR